MTKQKFLLLLFGFCSLFDVYGQTTIYTCNGKYRIELPNKIELQASELNNIKQVRQGNRTHVNITTQSGHITFQQKGLNNDERATYNKYCRVIIEYFKEDRNDPVFGKGDQIIIDKDIFYAVTETAKESCRRSGTPFMKLISLQSITINSFPVLYFSYRRKGWEGKQPPVIVNVYRIFNRYESVTLTFSYREAERVNWKDIHNNIINSFNFTRKY